MIFSFSDLLEAFFLGSVGRTKKKKVKISIFIMSIKEKNLLMSIFFFRRQKICWVGSLEKLKINYVWPYFTVTLKCLQHTCNSLRYFSDIPKSIGNISSEKVSIKFVYFYRRDIWRLVPELNSNILTALWHHHNSSSSGAKN